MKKFITFEEFSTEKAKKTQVQLEHELSTKREAAANSFKELLSEFGVASIGELSEEDRLKFNEKLGTLTESALLLEGMIGRDVKEDIKSELAKIKKGDIIIIKNPDVKGPDYNTPVTFIKYDRLWNSIVAKNRDGKIIKIGIENDPSNEPYRIIKKSKTNESYGSSNDFGGPGLIVVGKTRKDNDLIDQATEESGFYGIYNPQEKYWFFPEGGDQATIDKIENELETIFMKKGANVRYEAQYESVNESKFKVDDLVYNTRTKTVGIVRMGDDKHGEVKTDADGNVNVDELEKYNPIKFKHQTKAKVAPSTENEVSSRGLFNPFKNESVVTESEIKSDDEFKEYAFTVLQKAFGDDFDEAKAQEVVDGILGKVDGDYGKAAGILQSSLG